MQEEDNKILKIVTRIFMAMFMIIFITIMIRFLTKNVLVDIFQIDNNFIKEIAEDGSSTRIEKIDIDCKEKYSFEEENNSKKIESLNFIEKYTNLVNKIKSQLENYSSNLLFDYEKIVEIAKSYEKTINWNLIVKTDTSTPIKMEDGYWSVVTPECDYSQKANNIVEFGKYLSNENIELIYVQAPKKTQDYSDEMLNLYSDYSTKNIDNVINILKNNQINVLDLREKIRNENLDVKSLFFKTDHHWTGKTALWATKYIATEINNKWNMNLNFDLYNNNMYYTVSFENKFLGSSGRYITLSKAKSENFDIILPKFETNLTVNIPEFNIKDKTGDIWNTLFHKEILNRNDYYGTSTYDTYGYNDVSLIHIKNNKISDDENILLLSDSFGAAITPYLSLGVENLYRIDLRDFSGSIKKFIKENKITKVMLLYYPDSFYNKEAESLFKYN